VVSFFAPNFLDVPIKTVLACDVQQFSNQPGIREKLGSVFCIEATKQLVKQYHDTLDIL
jgi:hypothetical protein